MPGGGNLLLNGPVWWFFVIVLFLAGILAAYVVVDSLIRHGRGRYPTGREPWWVYTVPQALYLLILLTVQFPFVPNWGGAVVFVLMPFALAEQFAYLLRIVFPKPPAEPSADDVAEGEPRDQADVDEDADAPVDTGADTGADTG